MANSLDATQGFLLGLQSAAWESQLGEKGARRADARTRALYHDLYSPEAQVEQYRRAGLSVGLLASKGAGMQGTSGAQAQTGSVHPINVDNTSAMLNLAQIKNINADTEKKQEETKKITSETTKTDAEVENLLEQNGLIKLQKDYQDICNDIKKYEKIFVEETNPTNIEMQKQSLDELITRTKKLKEEAKIAGADAIVAQSTIDSRIEQQAQQVAINDMQLNAMQSGIKLNNATIEKIKADIFNNNTMREIAQAKAPQEIEEIKQRMINSCERILIEQHDLERKDKEFVWSIIEGAFNIFNRAASNTIGLVKVGGDIATKVK